MYTNTIKARLQAGQPVIGVFITVPAPTVVEFAALGGFDFAIIDAEHGMNNLETMENMVRAAEACDIVPIARVGINEAQLILRYLDAGVMGVQIPQIQTAQEAQAVVDAVKYRPLGKRGLAGVRAARYGVGQPLGRYIQEANAETLVVVQIETPEAVEKAREIAAVPTVDVVFVGPTDLSYSLGYPGEPMREEVQSVIRELFGIIRDAGKVPGIWAGFPDAARAYIEQGALYVTVTERNLVVPAFQAYTSGIKSLR